MEKFEADVIKINEKVENKFEGYIDAVGKGVKLEVSNVASSITKTGDEILEFKKLAGKAVNQSIDFIEVEKF